MGTIDRSRVSELMAQAEGLGYGLNQIGLLEEAVRLADLLADVDLGFDARSKLIQAAEFGGAPEKALVAFSWCLSRIDRDPGRFDERNTLWQYKWIIGTLASFPQISRAQIKAALDDLTRRIEKAGYGMRPVCKLQYKTYSNLGEVAEYHAAYARWEASPRGDLSDCTACDLNSQVSYLASNGREEEALVRARPIFDGSARCAAIPHSTLAEVLLPLVKLGRLDEAMKYHHRGYRLIARNRYFLEEVSQHVDFLALTDNLAKGLKLFQAHLPWAIETFDLDDRFRFSLASRFLFDRLRSSGKRTVKLALPAAFPGFEPSGKYEVSALLSWLEADSADLASRFDARNGNNSFALRIEKGQALESFVTPHPLVKRGKGGSGPPP